MKEVFKFFFSNKRIDKFKKKVRNQLIFLAPTLQDQLNQKHELYRLSGHIDWEYFEDGFNQYYSDQGRPAHPIRLMTFRY